MADQMYLTREGLEKLKEELEHLRTVRRPEVAALIQESREKGGTVGNGELEDAKNELAFIEGRILTLDNMINNAVIIEQGQVKRDVVDIGTRVTVKNQRGQTQQYVITGSAEADPAHGRISNVSPIGKALLGKKAGDVTEVNVPSGKIKLEIVSLE